MNQLIRSLVDNGQDFEFYPTTSEILQRMLKDLAVAKDGLLGRRGRRVDDSFLDVGAGNGKVLEAVRDAGVDIRSFYAIEKSMLLIEQLDPNFIVVGTDFFQQNLISKEVGVVFSNPPYSVFEYWAVKLLREVNAPLVYLVIPKRWKDSEQIDAAMSYRGAKAKVLGEYDFLESEDRTARAQVQLLRITFEGKADDDLFEQFFKTEFFNIFQSFEEAKFEDNRDRFSQLVVGKDYVETLVNLYNDEMAVIERNYRAVAALDVALLKELNVDCKSLCASLKKRFDDLRHLYWQELFSRLTTITKRLTTDSRRSLLDTLQRHVEVDFTVSNICAVVIWVIKNANRYLDSQFIETYEKMVNAANVVNYKSNQRTFVQERWRYAEEKSANSHYSLDYRVVTERTGGVSRIPYGRGGTMLDDRAGHFLSDLICLARNLGFDPDDVAFSYQHPWEPGERNTFYGRNRAGERDLLFEVRAFLNGNLHFRFSPKLILALNVEHGRLKGWLRSGQEAADEMGKPEAAQWFGAMTPLGLGHSGLFLEQATPQSPATVEGQDDEVEFALV